MGLRLTKPIWPVMPPRTGRAFPFDAYRVADGRSLGLLRVKAGVGARMDRLRGAALDEKQEFSLARVKSAQPKGFQDLSSCTGTRITS